MFKIFKQMNTENNSSQPLQVLNKSELCGRQFTVYGTADQPLFLAKDVAEMIEHTNPRVMLDVVEEDEKVVNNVYTLGGNQQAWFLTEDGLYEVLMQSRKPIAKEFKHGVKQILKEIRKNGGYMAAREGETEQELFARAVLMAKATIDRQQQQLQETRQQLSVVSEINEQQERQLTEQAPKVLFAEAVATSEQSVLVKDVAAILTQNGRTIGQNRLFKLLRERGYLGRTGDYYNQPTQRAMEMGLFELKKTTIQKPDGTVLVTTTPKVTGKGQIYFVNHLLKEIA